MINIQAQTCDEAWQQAAKLVRNNGLAQESRTFRSEVTTETLELLHAGMTIENPRDRLVFSRPINPAFAIAEVIWILAGSNDLAFIRFWNETMKNFSDDGYSLRGAYGYRLGGNAEGDFGDGITHDRTSYFVPSQFNFNQLKAAYQALSSTPHSRQVILQIWDGQDDFPYDAGKPRSKDIPCNITSDLKVRNGKLHWLQTMRSNDLMWGTPYNFIQWTSLQEIVAGWLGLEVGQYTHIASSLHVYQEHWEELKNLRLGNWTEGEQLSKDIKRLYIRNNPENNADLRIEGYDNWLPVFKTVLHAAVELTHVQHHTSVYRIVEEACNVIPIAYRQWLYVLGAEVCRKFDKFDDAQYLAARAGTYYQTSWLQWFERKQAELVKQ